MQPTLEQALLPIVQALQADGYTAVITEAQDLVGFQILAESDACEECLSPRSVIEPMIVHALREAGFQHRVQLEYPVQGSI